MEKSEAVDLFTSVALVLKYSPLAKLSPEVAASSINAFTDRSSLYQTLESASEAGCVRLLDRLGPREWSGLSENFRSRRQLHGISFAAKTGDVDVLAVLLLFEYQTGRLYSQIAVRNLRQEGDKPLTCGHPQVIAWLLHEECLAPVQLCMAASAMSGDWAFVKWVHEHGELIIGPAKRWFLVGHNAARLGNFEMVKWMHANSPNDFTDMTLRGAIEGGHLEIAQWANDQGLKDQFRILFPLYCPLHFAAIDLPMAQWLWDEIQKADKLIVKPWIENLLLNAARHGRLDIIEWFHAHGLPADQV